MREPGREVNADPQRAVSRATGRIGLGAAVLLRRIGAVYFSALTFVWKMASHFPFSFFQTVPAL